MSLNILESGFWTTIQDLGRFGSQKYGITVGGAMDSLAVRVANILVGNNENEGTLEITMFGTKVECKRDYLIAITGGDLKPTIDNKTAPMWRPILIKKGQVLKFNGVSTGFRAYVAFAGGFDVPKFMESKSTYTKAEIGGYKGRKLQTDDILHCDNISASNKYIIDWLKEQKHTVRWSVNYSSLYSMHKKDTIRILSGSEFNQFDEKSRQLLFNNPYKITVNADRMGYQLEGEKLQLSKPFELLSEGVTYGTIQVPANGQPIILMVDRQTIGGYPKIGQVISADLPRLAQLKPGDSIKFELVTMKEAENLLIQQELDLMELKLGINLKIQGKERQSNECK